MTSIINQPVECTYCHWDGIVHDCEPDEEGELRCPVCFAIVEQTANQVDAAP